MEENDSEHPQPILKYTAKKGAAAIDCLVVLLERQDQSTLFELLKWISVEKNLFEVLQALLNGSKEIKINKRRDGNMLMELTRLCAEKGQTESVLELVAWDGSFIRKADDDGNSLFHLIARKGHHQTTKAILKNPDVKTKKKNAMGQTALHVAIQGGHRMTNALILKTDNELARIKDNNKMTPLMYACQTGNIYVVKLLLEMQKEAQVNIGFLDCDVNGLNCLDHAIDNGHEMIAVTLLDQDNWRNLMTNATRNGGTSGGPKMTPMRKLISSMPGVGKFVLDKCITKVKNPSDAKDDQIKVDFELLEDWYSDWMKDGDDREKKQREGNDKIVMTELSPGSRDNDKKKDEQISSNFDSDGKLKPNAKISVKGRLSRSKNHPVQHMLKSDDGKELLNHPVVRLMFKNKTNAFRIEYWLRFFLQLTLLFFLTLHSLIIPPPYYVKKHLPEGNYTWLADGEAKWKEDLDPIALVLFGSIGTWLILLLTVIYFFEMLRRKWLYRTTQSNSMNVWISVIRELTLQILIILFVVPGFGDLYFSHGVTFKAEWQWELGAYAVLLAWINFIYFLQTASFFGIYILMFLEVLSTMVNFLPVAGIFLCTFAVVFCILIINQTQYHTFGDSLAKSLTMLTDGIDFDTVFHPMDYLYQQSATEDFTNMVFYPHTTHIIFIIFLFSMPIVVMNLLTGLAVYDIDVIQKKAEILKQTIEAKRIMAVQSSSFPKAWKDSVFQHQTITVVKNLSSLKAVCYKLTGYKDTHEYLVAFLDKLEKTTDRVAYTKTTDMKIDDMMDRIDDVSNELNNLSDSTLDACTLHVEAISGVEQLKQQMQVIQDKLDKMCRSRVV
ncbi:transient receptor potential cation channel subfamily A member 1-like [Strongylocentrotus purpuratus]|uniref:Ion transport domain-containing protein n=1 Tax=Strongylocentrotus purpuratus TaxID=7668 RepID=A0A7M7HR98_STRPU|nr:transient receptor potential cation channel subfamily A member 1-like [Strongylocentrotus purpuratus]